MIAIRNQDYIWSIGDILKHPLDPLKPHLSDITTLYGVYLPGLLLLVLILFLLHLIKTKKIVSFNLLFLTLFLWWLPPLIANATFAKVFTARYMLYTIPPLFLVITYLVDKFQVSQPSKISHPRSFSYSQYLFYLSTFLFSLLCQPPLNRDWLSSELDFRLGY